MILRGEKMKNVRKINLIMALILVVATGQGFGFTEYKDGGTHIINSTINNDVWVDYLKPAMQTTVSLVEGGSTYNLYGYGNSRLMVSGGSVGADLCVNENGHLTFSKGTVLGQLRTYNTSLTTISGGAFELVSVTHNSQVTMSGGTVNDNLWVIDNGQLTFSNGSVLGELRTYNTSLTTISGGEIEYLRVAHSSQVAISGGSVLTDFTAYDNGLATMSGGIIHGNLLMAGYADLTINGANFAINGVPVGFGEITSLFGGNYLNEPYRQLTGTLANGDILNNQFQIGEYASITLVPEPTSMLLLGLGGLLLSRRKK
jgi:hypothetical protein